MIAIESDPVRSSLLKLANDLPYFAKSQKPAGAILAEAKARLQQIEQSLDPSEPFNRITAEELASGNFDLTYLIVGVLVKDQPAGLVAPKKSLKTNISIDLAISLATGGKFLGYFRVAEPKRMAVLSGESGMATIQETALRISDAAGVALNETGIIFSDTVPSFGDSLNMEAFRRFLKADGIEVVIVDPVYLCLPCDVNPANLFDIGRMLRNVNDVCQDVGATPVLVHHLKKTVANPFVPGQLEDIGWAGFQEFFRQWMLINRREQYEPGTGQYRLWFSTGGSAGHSCLVGLDVFEGEFNPHTGQPRVWEVNVVKPKEVISEEADRREEAKERKADIRTKARIARSRKKMLAAMKKHPTGETLTALADQSGLPRNRAKEAIEILIESGDAETCKVIKGRNKREIDGYKLASNDGQSIDPDTRTK